MWKQHHNCFKNCVLLVLVYKMPDFLIVNWNQTCLLVIFLCANDNEYVCEFVARQCGIKLLNVRGHQG